MTTATRTPAARNAVQLERNATFARTFHVGMRVALPAVTFRTEVVTPERPGVIVSKDVLANGFPVLMVEFDEPINGKNVLEVHPANLVTLTQTPALDAPAVSATDILRTLRSHGMEPDTVRQTQNGDFSLKFEGGNARYWARRVLAALPDAQLVSKADGFVALVVVRV